MHQNMVLVMKLYDAIWQSKQNGTDITQVQVQDPLLVNGAVSGRWFVNGELRGFDFSVNSNGKVMSLRLLEQNPNKRDQNGNLKHFANLAQQGHRICWLIDTSVQNGFIGRIHNGEWHFSQPRATTPAYQSQPQPSYQAAAAPSQSNVSQTVPTEVLDMDMIPDLPEDVSVPDFVLNHMASIDEEPPNDYDQ